MSGALQREPLPWRAAVKLQGVRIHLPLSGIGRSVEHTLYDSLCILLSCGCPNRLGELPGDRFIVRRVGIRGFIVLRRCDGGGRFGRWWCLGFRGERMGRCKDELSGIQLYDVTAALLPCDAPLYPVCGNYFVAVGVLYGFGGNDSCDFLWGNARFGAGFHVVLFLLGPILSFGLLFDDLSLPC